MREFKFRAWDGREMHYNVAAWDGMSYKVLEDTPDTNDMMMDDLWGKMTAPMQYTGLKDKNGKEIYEGDIVSIQKSSLTHRVEVEFIDGFFTCCDLYIGNCYGIEVIGNIYENHDLLEDK